MANGFSMLFEKIAQILAWFGKLFVAVFVAAWDFATDVACWVFEGLLEITHTALSALDLSALDLALGAWGGLPPEIINVMGLLGVGQASVVIVAAIGIRLALQLIPFTRLGS